MYVFAFEQYHFHHLDSNLETDKKTNQESSNHNYSLPFPVKGIIPLNVGEFCCFLGFYGKTTLK